MPKLVSFMGLLLILQHASLSLSYQNELHQAQNPFHIVILALRVSQVEIRVFWLQKDRHVIKLFVFLLFLPSKIAKYIAKVSVSKP